MPGSGHGFSGLRGSGEMAHPWNASQVNRKQSPVHVCITPNGGLLHWGSGQYPAQIPGDSDRKGASCRIWTIAPELVWNRHQIHKKNPPHADSIPPHGHTRAALTACLSRPAMRLFLHSGCRFTSARMLAPMNSARAKASFFFSSWMPLSLKPSNRAPCRYVDPSATTANNLRPRRVCFP